MTDSSPINRHRNWNALARTPDGLSTHVVATIDSEIVASACGLESDDWCVVEQDDGPVRLCGTCANHFGGTGPQPIAFQDPVELPVDGVDVGPIGTKATFTEAYGGGR